MNQEVPPPKPPRDRAPWILLALVVIVGYGGWRYLNAVQEPPEQVDVAVPVTSLPAYHVIQRTDVAAIKLEADSVPAGAFDAATKLVGLYTLVPVEAYKPLTAEQVHTVPNPTLLGDTVTFGIAASADMVLGGNLKAGDVVDILLVPPMTDAQPSPTPIPFPNILVLDVKQVVESQATNDKPSERPFVVVIALPSGRLDEFATKSVGATMLITRKP
jgi:Flp pilus assembly protein CpaB